MKCILSSINIAYKIIIFFLRLKYNMTENKTSNEPQTKLNFPLDGDTIDNTLTKKLTNKKQIPLLFPYSERADAKKLGAKWNAVDKTWYYPSIDGSLPDELLKYRKHDVYIEYDDKEYYKEVLPSMKFDKERRVWTVNERDYNIFIKL